MFEAIDIGAEVELGRRDAMAAPVAREKRDFFAGEISDNVVVRRAAPRAIEQHFFVLFEAGHGV